MARYRARHAAERPPGRPVRRTAGYPARHAAPGRPGAHTVIAAGLGAVGVALIVTAFGPGRGDGPPAPASGQEPAHLAGTTRVLDRATPVGLAIPAIGVKVNGLVPLRARPGGPLPAPERYDTVGWHVDGPWPGEGGAAVLVGHADSGTGRAVLYRLGDLRPGHTITVDRAVGPDAVFTVHRVERYRKSSFPTRKVYGPTGNRAELRLITCGGDFDAWSRTYRDNTVVYATLTIR